VERHIYLMTVSSPCQRQCELLPSLGARRPSSFVRRLSSINYSHFNFLLMQRSLQVVIRQMFVLCSLKIAAQWSEPMSFTFHSALRKLNTDITLKYRIHEVISTEWLPSLSTSIKLKYCVIKRISTTQLMRLDSYIKWV
jgi:hypothetical protein